MVPFFLVADQIFSLKEWLMCPLAGKQLTDKMRKVFNYRLSLERIIIEYFRNFSGGENFRNLLKENQNW